MAFEACSTKRRHASALTLTTLTAGGEKAHMFQPLDEPRWGLNGITSYHLLGGMKTAFRFSLYPNHKQELRLLRMIETSRRLWNDALAHRKRRWEEERLSTSYSQQCWILTAERRLDPLLGELYSQAGQDILRRLDRAFKAFFEHRAGYPRFKKFSSSGSFTYPQAYNGSVKPDAIRRRLFLSKVGNVKAVFHRRMPPHGKPKTCTVVREPNGKGHVSLVYEDDKEIAQPSTKPASPVGIDLIEITDSDHGRREDSTPAVPQEGRGEAGSPPKELLEDAQRLGEQSPCQTARSCPARQGCQPARGLQPQAVRRACGKARLDRLRGPKGQEHGQKPRTREVDHRCRLGSASTLHRAQGGALR